jgi:sialate O-acetylesterase
MDQPSFSLAVIFGDSMVLQRNQPVKLWGECTKAQTLRVFIDDREVAGARVRQGKWKLVLPAMEASQSIEISIQGEGEGDAITFHDVAVGEVWIAGGQSNMEFPLEYDAEAKQVIPAANNADIRFYDCPKIKFPGQELEDDFSQAGFWRPLTPANAQFYSAVGFYFANQIYEHLQVPVGIVGCNWGGTTASTWLGEHDLEEDEALSVYCREYQASLEKINLKAYDMAERIERQAGKDPVRVQFFRSIMKNTPGRLIYPFCTAYFKLISNNSLPFGPRDHNRPGGLYHNMVQKIAGYTARGVIWYQGETDNTKPELYARLFAAVIRCWRRDWEADLPFVFVQLAPFERWMGLPAISYPILREQQELVSKTVPGTYMASIMDSGLEWDVHPKHKRVVGERLALLARARVYGEDVLCDPPEATDFRCADGRLTISFANAGDGLHLNGEKLQSLEVFADGSEVKQFSASVDQNDVVVDLEGIQAVKELEVRLAFRNFALINLYNSYGLPAKPFRRTIQLADTSSDQ